MRVGWSAHAGWLVPCLFVRRSVWCVVVHSLPSLSSPYTVCVFPEIVTRYHPRSQHNRWWVSVGLSIGRQVFKHGSN